ncbi:hypothetical protein [Leptodesmis sp.]|uniref:hypothetical protein n=1 Tax=Leptodesmis sp. TaxID=3100501 RepID=UPI0040534FE3
MNGSYNLLANELLDQAGGKFVIFQGEVLTAQNLVFVPEQITSSVSGVNSANDFCTFLKGFGSFKSFKKDLVRSCWWMRSKSR